MDDTIRIYSDQLDQIEAQLDSTVPHYVPRLVREIRMLWADRARAEEALALAVIRLERVR